MKIDIWSDIMCPFCYIGKRKLETAMSQFPHQEEVEIIWHSFQLDPNIQHIPGKDIYSYLADRYGKSREWSVNMHHQMVENARKDGLEYNFEKAIIANSFDAHRLIQMAKAHQLGALAEERLFKAYFTEGENISDHETLIKIGAEIGLDTLEVTTMLSGDDFRANVNKDIDQARTFGIRGVPFFLFNEKYAISGAQPVEVFLNGLDTAWRNEKGI